MGGPTLESLRFGYTPERVETRQAQPTQSDYNDMAAGWAPMRTAETGASPMVTDGTPVEPIRPGSVVSTSAPINGGVDENGGTRPLLVNLYGDAVAERDELLTANQDLHAALENSETRAADFEQRLLALQAQFDALGTERQDADQRNFDLAARLATAQIARLEAERALLEATIEWRRMSADNNRSLGGSAGGRRRP